MVKRGFTLVEIMTVIVIIGILGVITYQSYTKAVDNSRIDAAEGDLRSMSQGLNSFFIDYGAPEISTSLEENEYKNKVAEIVDILNRQYLPCEIEIDAGGYNNSATGYKGFTCMTKIKKDPWGQVYTIRMNTEGGVTGVPAGVTVINSTGKDRESNYLTYKDKNYGDDVLVIVEPK